MAQRQYARPININAAAISAHLSRLWLRIILIGGGVMFLAGAGTILWWSKDLPNPSDINNRRVSESTKIFDRTGKNLLYEIGDVHRTVIPLNRISNYVRQATIAAEDDQFYEHRGLSVTGILRSLWVDLRHGSRQGGSTITQQLIKNSILTPEKTFQRKFKEAVLAIELEQRFDKDTILEMYLNDIPYGSQAYGIEAASQLYFKTSASDLTLAQAATIAAMTQAPSRYSPYGSHVDDLKRRQEWVLDRMAGLNMISREQAEAAKKEKLEFAPRREAIQAPHFVFYVKELLDNEYGGRVVEQGGLTITTTLDADLQKIAEETLKEKQAQLKSVGASNAALVALDPKTGDILALAGSIDYFDEEIDGNVNVAIRPRSPGSSIKPFVYASAFEKGYTPDTILVDAETDFGQGYSPKNYDLKEHGPVPMKQALGNSLNIPAVQTLYLTGVKDATTLAQRMGMSTLTNPDRYGLSLVLGGGEVTLLEETSAYGVFANDGARVPPRALLKVNNNSGSLFDATASQPQGEQVLSQQVARTITNVLSTNENRAMIFGAVNNLTLGSRPVAAKTGTTQEFRDAWTIGYTPSFVAGIWIGNNDNSPMKDNSPSARSAAPVWNAFMRKALANRPIEQFTKPNPRNDIVNQYLNGQLPELKAKWQPETNLIYSLDCPVDLGQPKTFKELHSVLYYVQRTRPNGPPPDRPENDSQFDRWEQAVAAWRDKNNEATKSDPAAPHYVASLPQPTCGISDSSELPQVRIIEPDTTVLRGRELVHVVAEVESLHPIKEVRFLVDGQQIAKRGPNDPYEAVFSYPANFSGRKTLQIMALTEDNLIGQAHRTFVINPDDSAPQVQFLYPKDGAILTPTSFPLIVKVSASDKNGLDYVDILYTKDGRPGTQRIGRVATVSATAANRYEATWPDSPGTGTYYVYAVAYDKTGNSTQTDPKTVIIE